MSGALLPSLRAPSASLIAHALSLSLSLPLSPSLQLRQPLVRSQLRRRGRHVRQGRQDHHHFQPQDPKGRRGTVFLLLRCSSASSVPVAFYLFFFPVLMFSVTLTLTAR